MADDRMKNDDRKKNMGTGDREDQGFGQGQQTPGRNPQGGQQEGGQFGQGQPGQQGQQGGQRNKPMNEDDDENEFSGGSGQRGQSRGGQNR